MIASQSVLIGGRCLTPSCSARYEPQGDRAGEREITQAREWAHLHAAEHTDHRVRIDASHFARGFGQDSDAEALALEMNGSESGPTASPGDVCWGAGSQPWNQFCLTPPITRTVRPCC